MKCPKLRFLFNPPKQILVGGIQFNHHGCALAYTIVHDNVHFICPKEHFLHQGDAWSGFLVTLPWCLPRKGSICSRTSSSISRRKVTTSGEVPVLPGQALDEVTDCIKSHFPVHLFYFLLGRLLQTADFLQHVIQGLLQRRLTLLQLSLHLRLQR